ncbi:hypothetical protein [Streptomyces althioticus]|uniref:hypothetical protein n=1 Tax=Streptomyces althioticus TaxID=83380 RepID=UPI00368AAAC3
MLGAAALLFAPGLTASPVMTTPAHAAYGPCNTTVKRTDGLAVNNYHRVPARTGNGLSCYGCIRRAPGFSPVAKRICGLL